MRNAPRTKAKSPEDLTEDKAFSKILRLVTACEQPSQVVRDRLLRDGYPLEVVECALGRAQTCGIVDDTRYAEYFVRSRIAKGRGLPSIERDLHDLGIAACETEAYSDYISIGEDQELERAVALLERRPPRSKNLRDGAFRKLVQNGYSMSIASQAATLWIDRYYA